MERFLCIHGHFYQPPRENPWLEAVEVQDSAHPFHDWNERITHECYGPNAAARVSTWDGRILDIRNNYLKISYNFGPTLLSWLEEHRPDVYEDIIEADRRSVRDRNGHGNALAQAYNHAILPLATRREKELQVAWGMEDFRERFGRDPEGMWLPECAVDTETLEVLAQNGILFTVLAPRQAMEFRVPGEGERWSSCDNGSIDPTRPYIQTLPSGRNIAIFFYDGPISQAVAFEGLLNDSHVFAERLMQGFNGGRTWPQLLHIATDGESYGHHHRRGEMALAYTLHLIERDHLARLTNYGEYLSLHPPAAEVRIHENSSWSCAHGIERWRDNCGCNSGTHPGWHQKWRAPLREAFRTLADRAWEIYDVESSRHFHDAGAALRAYIRVVLSPNRLEAMREFLDEFGRNGDSDLYETEVLRLMELVRNAQLLFTSCAWFFDEVSGIETVQNMRYAGRLLQLLEPYDAGVGEGFLQTLEAAPGNLRELPTAADVYTRHVRPRVVDLHRVIAHHAITNFDSDAEGHFRLFCYELHVRDSVAASFGTTRLRLSRIGAQSLIDGESVDVTAVVLHFGGHDFRCSLSGQLSYTAYRLLCDDLVTIYQRRSLTELVRIADEYFGRTYYGIDHLFTEGRRELLRRVTNASFERFDATIAHIYEENRKFMDFLLEMNAPLPPSFLAAAEFVLRHRFLDELSRFHQSRETDRLREIALEARRYRLKTDDEQIRRSLEDTFSHLFEGLAAHPTAEECRLAIALLEVFDLLGMRPDHWFAQNIVFALVHGLALPARFGARAAVPREAMEPEVRAALEELAASLNVSIEPFERTISRLRESALGGSSDRIAMISREGT